ncbi:MAG: LuxR C-terminal-related transcriptional regulator [Acidimicrobiales bacterium]
MPFSVPLGSERVTIVSGPAGSGKTSLLTQWFDALPADGPQPLWHAAGSWQPTDDVVALIQGAGGGPQRVLFIDDAHQLDASVMTELFNLLAGDRHESWRLVLAGRSCLVTDFDLAGWDQLSIRNHREISLSTEAVSEILLAHRSDLTPDQLQLLVKRINGWAAGAQLAGQAIGSTFALNQTVAEFSGRHPLVAEYLETEMFSSLPHRDQEFLVSCSPLAELTPEACMLMSGDRFSTERLTRLNQECALISGGANQGTWQWRPMAREFLDVKLRRRPANEVAELRRRARGWSTARHAYGEAVSQGAEAGDWNAVVGIVLNAGPRISATGGGASVIDWLNRLPRSILELEAGLSVVAALALWASEGDDARPAIDDWLAHATMVNQGRPPSRATSIATATSAAQAAFGPASPGKRIELARSAMKNGAASDPSWKALCCWAIGMAAYFDDDPKTARVALSECLSTQATVLDRREHWFDPRLTAGAMGTLALMDLEDDIEQADILLSAAQLQSSDSQSRPVNVGTVQLAQARRALYSGPHEDAVTTMTEVGARSMLHEVRVLALLDAAMAFGQMEMPSHQQATLSSADRLLRGMISPGRLLARRRNAAESQPDAVETSIAGGTDLTDREVEVLRLLDSDMSRRQIAETLFLAHNTVKTYVQRLYRKLGVSSRPAAVARGRERGWIP